MTYRPNVPILFAVLALAAPAGADAPAVRHPTVPVRLSGGAEIDPCSTGRVGGLKAAGDGFLSVRAAPATGAPELFRLGNRDTVWVCDERSGWLGILRPRRDTDDCGGATRRAAGNHPYDGPCLSGWASKRWITIVAG